MTCGTLKVIEEEVMSSHSEITCKNNSIILLNHTVIGVRVWCIQFHCQQSDSTNFLLQGYHYCPGQYVENVTTPDLTDYSHNPLLFHLGRDPGEKYIIR